MTDENLRDLASLAALGALDGDDAEAFAAAVAASPAIRRELDAFRRAAELLPVGLTPVAPAPGLRRRVLAAALGPAPAARRAPRVWLGLAAAAALACGAGWWQARAQRDAARLDAREAYAAADAAQRQLAESEARLAAALDQGLRKERALRRLVSYEDTRLAHLAGLAAAPQARARVLWSATGREAVLVATGLKPAPPGMGYEVWVIAGGAPVPAGVFQVEADGGALFRLPDVAETAVARTFAVTLEPASGTPAPTGPMVLAGSAS